MVDRIYPAAVRPVLERGILPVTHFRDVTDISHLLTEVRNLALAWDVAADMSAEHIQDTWERLAQSGAPSSGAAYDAEIAKISNEGGLRQTFDRLYQKHCAERLWDLLVANRVTPIGPAYDMALKTVTKAGGLRTDFDRRYQEYYAQSPEGRFLGFKPNPKKHDPDPPRVLGEWTARVAEELRDAAERDPNLLDFARSVDEVPAAILQALVALKRVIASPRSRTSEIMMAVSMLAATLRQDEDPLHDLILADIREALVELDERGMSMDTTAYNKGIISDFVKDFFYLRGLCGLESAHV